MSQDLASHQVFWAKLRESTAARIGLPRSGTSITTAEHLSFKLAHAKARDAVHEGLDAEAMTASLSEFGPPRLLHSRARDRAEYLLRPDLGRMLDETSRHTFETSGAEPLDICFIVADGLSPRAVHINALPLLRLAWAAFQAEGWRIGPISLVAQGRVAIGDEIGHLCRAALCAVLIGERPGLSADDSLGVYLTWGPKPGRSDAERNCLSNIRQGGQSCEDAARRLLHLCRRAWETQATGVALKDDMIPYASSLIDRTPN